ncbi:thermonuclease family protein [Synechococcus sp. ATX 2A4]|uniref:thermonuclease family protein n=1 Tax=Synechococcus sp. ATX 2A4 TaxID=2823727 RepID=UPI0020CB88E3|nr:thermonuclease family protein [Synechococcus sp. ATX 2A4]
MPLSCWALPLPLAPITSVLLTAGLLLPQDAGAQSGPAPGRVSSAQAELPATVLSIGDGDSIAVLQGGQRLRIRLACIDAPETAQTPHGKESRAELRRRLRVGAAVTLRVQTVDRFGRTVAEVIAGTNIGLAMVESGHAFVFRRYLKQCDANAYLAAEQRAMRRRAGIWQVPGGITRPWDFRRQKRSGVTSPSGGLLVDRQHLPRPLHQFLAQRLRAFDADADAETEQPVAQVHVLPQGPDG